MIDEELLNYAIDLALEISNYMIPDKRLYVSGNMQKSVSVVYVDDNTIDVVIATDYASYTNERGKWAGWVQRVVDEKSRRYSEHVSNNSADKLDEINGDDEE